MGEVRHKRGVFAQVCLKAERDRCAVEITVSNSGWLVVVVVVHALADGIIVSFETTAKLYSVIAYVEFFVRERGERILVRGR